MRLAKLEEYRRLLYTPESAPCLVTLRAKNRAGKLLGGRIIDGHHYVDLDEIDRIEGLRNAIDTRKKELEKNPLLEGLI